MNPSPARDSWQGGRAALSAVPNLPSYFDSWPSSRWLLLIIYNDKPCVPHLVHGCLVPVGYMAGTLTFFHAGRHAVWNAELAQLSQLLAFELAIFRCLHLVPRCGAWAGLHKLAHLSVTT